MSFSPEQNYTLPSIYNSEFHHREVTHSGNSPQQIVISPTSPSSPRSVARKKHGLLARVLQHFNLQKSIIILSLLIQNAGLALCVKLSKKYEEQYVPSTVVVLNELIKFLVSLGIYLQGPGIPKGGSSGSTEKINYFILQLFERDNLYFIVPCLIYATQNNLIFVALNLIDAALYQLLSNLKIISTALFAVLLTGKKLHRLQWMALILLAIGEALAEGATSKSDADADNIFAGTLLMILYASLSGFAGVFTERMLKKSNQLSFWLKSMILYFWGFAINFAFLIYNDWEIISRQGFFYGYTIATWMVVILLGFGGLLVSVVITQFDNIVKVYVTCCSLFLTSIASYIMFDFHYTTQFVLSGIIVCISVLVYSDPVVVASV